MPTEADLVGRIILAGVLAALLGAERELTEQPAGMRTHTLVGLGAALFTVVSAYGFQGVVGHSPSGSGATVDVSRVTAGVVTGIGFLGAGAILKLGTSIRGLTTAASLWVTAAIGAAVGVGQLGVGAATTGVVLLALVGLRPLRTLLHHTSLARQELVIETTPDADLASLVDEIASLSGLPGSDVRIVGTDGASLRLTLRLGRGARPAHLAELLERRDDVHGVDWS